MDDAGVGRHDLEVVEGPLSPAQEGVALTVARELEFCVERERVGAPEVIDLHRVVDDEFHRLQRVDTGRVAAERDHRVTHGGKVDHAGNAGEVLEQDARRHERDLLLDRRGGVPVGEGTDVVRLDEGVVLAAQQVFEQDLHRVRQARHARITGSFERRQAVHLDRLIADSKLGAGIETIHSRHERLWLGAGGARQTTIVPLSKVKSSESKAERTIRTAGPEIRERRPPDHGGCHQPQSSSVASRRRRRGRPAVSTPGQSRDDAATSRCERAAPRHKAGNSGDHRRAPPGAARRSIRPWHRRR